MFRPRQEMLRQRIAATRYRIAVALAVGLMPLLAQATATINHKFDPATMWAGDESVYTITVMNSSGVPLTSANVTSLLGADVRIIEVEPTTNGCGFDTAALAAGGSNMVLAGGNVPAQVGTTPGECSVSFRVTSTKSGNHTVNIPAKQAPSATQAGFQAVEGGTTVLSETDANATLLIKGLQPPVGSKRFETPAYVGKPFKLTITLENSNVDRNIPLTSFVDNLPAGMSVAPTPNASVVCTGTGKNDGQVVASGSKITLTGGAIGAATEANGTKTNGVCTVETDVVVSSIASGSNFVNTLPNGAIGNTRDLVSTGFQNSVTVQNPLRLEKSFSPATVPVGAASTMTIRINNNGAVPLTGAGLADRLPGDMQLFNPSQPGTVTCSAGGSGGALASDVATKTLTWTGGSVPANGYCEIKSQVTVTSETAPKNTLLEGAVTNNEGITSPAADASLQAYAQLRVNKAVAPSQIGPGQWAQFTITIQNYSNAIVTGTSVLDALPTIATPSTAMVLDYSAAPSSTCTGMAFTPGTVETSGGATVATNADGTSYLHGTGGQIPAASGTTPGSCTVTFRARLPEGTPKVTFTNTLNVGDVGNGTVGNTNPAPAGVTVVDAAQIGKSFNPSAIAQGQASTLTLTVTNRYVSTMTGVNLIDNLPSGLSLAADPKPTNTCGGDLEAYPNGNRVVLSNGTVLARPTNNLESTCQITVQVTGSTLGTYTNTIPADQFSSANGAKVNAVSSTLTINAGLNGAKSFSPASVMPGGTARVTVTLSNSTAAPLTGVSMLDDGLMGVTVANPANAATSCSGMATVTANPGASSVQLSGATIPAGGRCDVAFDVIANGAGTWENVIAPGKIQSAEGAINTAEIKATLGKQSAELAINKSFSKLLVQGNEPSVLRLDLINTSPIAMEDVSFTDAFPKGIVVYSVPNVNTTCKGATVAAPANDEKVVVTGVHLPPNGSCEVYVTVTSLQFLNLTNTIPAGAVTSRGGYTNAQPTSSTLSTLEGLGVSKGFTPAFVTPNQPTRLTIRLVNTFAASRTPFTGVSFSDRLDPGLTVAPNPNATTTCRNGVLDFADGAVVTLSGATLSPGEVCEVSIDVVADKKGAFVNELLKGSVTTNEGATNEVPGKSTVTVDDSPEVEKTFSPKTVTIGLPTKLTVTVKNPAGFPLTVVSLTDNLPVGMAVHKDANASTTCVGGNVAATAGGSTVTLSGATVPANNSCEFTAMVVANQAGDLTNTIGQGAISSYEGLTNGNPTSDTITVLTPPDVTKSFSPAQIARNGTSTLVVNLKNDNKEAITLTEALVDALPGYVLDGATPTDPKITGQVNVHSVPNINGNLPAGAAVCPGNVTAVAGDIRITYAKGSSIPPGGCSFSVDVTSAAAGAYLNVIAPGQLQTSAGVNKEPANATLGVDKPAAPMVKKSFSMPVITSGDKTRLTIELINPNDIPLTLDKALVDEMPTDSVLATPVSLTKTCPSVVQAVAGGSSVTYPKGAQLPPGSCTISVDVTATKTGAYLNVIKAGDLSTVEGGSNPTPTQDSFTVVPDNDPTVGKKFDPNVINAGAISRLTITLGNPNATLAVLQSDMVDVLPDNMTLAADPMLAGTCDMASVLLGQDAATKRDTVTYLTGATIPVSSSCTIQANVTSKTAGLWINQIPVGGLETNFGSNGAPAVDTLIVTTGSVPEVMKLFDPVQIAPGGVSTLAIILSNLGTSAAVLTEDLVDQLPPGMTVASGPVPPVDGLCTTAPIAPVGGTTVTYPKGAAIPVLGCLVAVNVTASTPGILTNEILAGQLVTDIGTNTTPTTADLEVLPAAGLAAISGNVYHDRDDNGLIGKTDEEGVAGVTVVLKKMTPSGLTTIATTTTNASGGYSFGDLPPGDGYIVSVEHPAGWINGKDTAGSKGGTANQDDAITGVTLVAGDNATDYNFGLRKPATLSGKVYHDKNDDGTVDPKEEGVGDVEIKVTWTDKDGKAQSKTTKTDKDGNYTFTDLPPGTEFTVTKIHPPGWINGKDTAGTHGGTVTDDVIGKVTLGSGDDGKDYNFGLRKNASISGKVYHDKDDGGVLNEGDVGVGEVEIKLTWKDAAGQDQSKTVTTGPDGSYRFDDLEADLEYTVTKIHPKGWEDRMDNVGTHGGTANQDDVISTIKLSSGDQAEEYNFGLYKKEAEPTPVPTMGQWSVVLLSLMLGFAGLRQRRRG